MWQYVLMYYREGKKHTVRTNLVQISCLNFVTLRRHILQGESGEERDTSGVLLLKSEIDP